MYPLNIESVSYPFETLTSTKFLRLENKFLVGINNPIVINEKDFWNLYVDVDEG